MKFLDEIAVACYISFSTLRCTHCVSERTFNCLPVKKIATFPVIVGVVSTLNITYFHLWLFPTVVTLKYWNDC